MISHHLDLTLQSAPSGIAEPSAVLTGFWVTGETFKKTHRLDLRCNITNVTPVLLALCKRFINSLRLPPLCHSCKHYAKLLESERHLSNGDLAFWAVYFPAQLCRAAAHKTETYLVSETENIDQKHVLLGEDKHASFIPHCQFPVRQKALESTTTGYWDDSISTPTTDKQIILNGVFAGCMNFDHFCYNSRIALSWR